MVILVANFPSTKQALSVELSTEISTLSSETLRDIIDLSNILHSRIYHDISDVINGAGPALDTLGELERFVRELSGDKITNLISKVVDLSGRETSHYNTLSTEIVNINNDIDNEISELSSITFSKLSTEISTLSSETTRDISITKTLTSNEISDLSSYTSNELSREINELSITTSAEITDLSNYTSSELSREIRDLSSETARDISATKSLTSYEISDLSSYTSSELSREINDLSTTTSQRNTTFLVIHQVNCRAK